MSAEGHAVLTVTPKTAIASLTNRSTHRSPPRGQRGQSLVEYTIICAVLAVCLFGTPVGKMLTDALRNFYGSLIFFLSLP